MSIEDRICKLTRDADWQDGMNVFRERVLKDLESLRSEIIKLKEIIKETP